MSRLLNMLTPEYIITFVLVALAVYRMSMMVATEYGPFDVFERLRNRLKPASMFGKLSRCPYCLSIWFGFAGAFILPYANPVWFVVTALGLSAVACILVKRYG